MTSTIAALREEEIETFSIGLRGKALLEDPLLNKGSAFTELERFELGLLGLLPPHVSSVEEQLHRTYENYSLKDSDIERYIFLLSLQDRNETLYYRLLQEHIAEMIPIIYTPVVGEGCRRYSHLFRRSRGLYISYPNRDSMDEILQNAPQNMVDVIVVTDGERILGLGDLGVGGMGIPVGKLTLYTLCAGIHPARTLPILLDAGTDNRELLDDPLYLGWRHERLRGQEYDDFVESFIQGVENRFPRVLLQWEDFAKNNARRLLERYRDRLCTFNDDIQGTGAVTLAGLLAAMKVMGKRLRDQEVALLGAGSASLGISDQIVAAMTADGLSEDAARSRIWLTDIDGLLISGRPDLDNFTINYAQPADRVEGWRLIQPDRIGLLDVIRNVRPTILIGASTQSGAFSVTVVRDMAAHCTRPIIFPLSNPTSKSEAVPEDLLTWTDGKAIVATGSPFPAISRGGKSVRIGQCNNSFIFPGVGLGVIASGAKRVTDRMFIEAAQELAQLSPMLKDPDAPVYPKLEDARIVSRAVALAVAGEAFRAGVTRTGEEEGIEDRVEAAMWMPRYLRYKALES
ncbi:MAG TPA: NAD-dependent malic enzyme [Blastocatellia bacterium]|nr:NAD-dependent malic enzyme [Blastocatellia bacterium]